MDKDPQIAWRHALAARAFQATYPMLQKAFFANPSLEFATKVIAPPATIEVATRHGPVDALVFSPTEGDLAALRAKGEAAPVHLLTHGGAYITRLPQEEGNVARYLASEIGCFVIVPDYHAAPQVRFPVAEEECFDTYLWILAHGGERGWDTNTVSVGGPSAGGSIALAVALMAIDQGKPLPVAVTTEYGVADVGRPDSQRPSAKKMPVVSPMLMNLVRNTYVKNVDMGNGYSSPLHHPRLSELPPVLVLTAEYDTLRHESNDLAAKLRDLGVSVTHKEFAGVDHGFTHQKPVAVAREAITMIGEHLRASYVMNRDIDPLKGRRMDFKADNAALVGRFLDEVVNGGRVELVDEIMAPEYVMRGGSLGTYKGREAYTAFLKANAGGAFGDMKLDVLALVADEDRVFVLFTNSGRNTGSFMGMPATGKSATWRGSALFRVEAGRIVESDYVEDLLMMFGQLGITQLPAN